MLAIIAKRSIIGTSEDAVEELEFGNYILKLGELADTLFTRDLEKN